MLQKVVDQNDLNKIKPLFKDIRFYMGRSVLQGLMGNAYVDNLNNPQIAFLVVRSYCFISGYPDKNKLKKIIDENFKDYKLIPSDNLKALIEDIYQENIIKLERYSIKKEVSFDIDKLQKMSDSLEENYKILKINEDLASRIKEEDFINITDNYKKYGIGYCCIYNNQIVGVASSNIFYQDGIEVNIYVEEEFRRKGIATALASNLILECLNQNKKVSWDAANINSVNLAKKLGFTYDKPYDFYKFKI